MNPVYPVRKNSGIVATSHYSGLDTTLAAVSYAVKRGEKIAKEAGCHLDD